MEDESKPDQPDFDHRRQCGECQLCCVLLPVLALKKAGGTACRFQGIHTGCTIYGTADRPEECWIWSCRWLINDDATELPRPDQSHYVIDVMPDYVTIRDRGGKTRTLEVVQIWVDPQHPNAHRDPALRRWIRKRAKKGIGALIRYSPTNAFAIFAPPLSDDGRWHEVHGIVGETTHTAADIAKALR
jgi:hypothetical protein